MQTKLNTILSLLILSLIGLIGWQLKTTWQQQKNEVKNQLANLYHANSENQIQVNRFEQKLQATITKNGDVSREIQKINADLQTCTTESEMLLAALETMKTETEQTHETYHKILQKQLTILDSVMNYLAMMEQEQDEIQSELALTMTFLHKKTQDENQVNAFQEYLQEKNQQKKIENVRCAKRR